MATEAVKPVLELLEQLVEKEAEYAREACSHCRLCNLVCPVYRVTGDERYTPYSRLWRALSIIRGRGRPSRSDDVEVLFTCALCGACSLACPASIRIWLLVWWARSRLALQGLLPGGLREVATNVLRSGHSFVERREDLRTLVGRLIESGVKVNEAGDVLLVPSPLESSVYPDLVAVKQRIAGDKLALSVNALDLGGNAFFDASSPEAGLKLLYNCIIAAEKIGAKLVAASECGADTKLVYLIGPIASRLWGGPRLTHFYDIVSLSLEFNDNTVVFTSCNYCRFPGPCLSAKPPRDKPPATMCCGGGGGLTLNREPWARRVRRLVSLERIKKLDAETIVVPCVKCLSTLQEAALLARRRVRVKSLAEYAAAKGGGEERRV